MERDLIIGDFVLLSETYDETWMECAMMPYLGTIGRVVEVTGIGHAGGQEFFINEDNQNFRWRTNVDVQRIISKDEVKGILEANKKKFLAQIEETLGKNKSGIILSPEKIKEIASSIYGEERVDMTIMGNIFNITVLFPEIVITNSKRCSHTIKDLYVHLEFTLILENIRKKAGHKCSIHLSGLRGKYHLKEFESGYAHSHLPGRGLASFCLGSSRFKLLIMETQEKMDEDTLTMLFLSLENYVKWESLEGGPHSRMENIRWQNIEAVPGIHEDIENSINKLPLSVWEYNEGLKLIYDSKEFHKYVNESSRVKSACGYTDEQLIKRTEEGSKRLKKELDGQTWKGEPIPSEVYADELFNENVSEEIIVKWEGILNQKAEEFLKHNEYETSKQRNREKVFGAYRALQQAKIDNKERVKGQDRLVAQ